MNWIEITVEPNVKTGKLDITVNNKTTKIKLTDSSIDLKLLNHADEHTIRRKIEEMKEGTYQ